METQQGRSRDANYKAAYDNIVKRLHNQFDTTHKSVIDLDRKTQVGSGQRGDKIRTYRFQNDNVKDHITHKQTSCTKVLKGYIDTLWQ